jgi:hypothetical protein
MDKLIRCANCAELTNPDDLSMCCFCLGEICERTGCDGVCNCEASALYVAVELEAENEVERTA